jgi:UDPglucose 6-dehydrogenase
MRLYSEPMQPSGGSIRDERPRVAVAVVGAGYVGLVAATCLADRGHSVACIENSPSRLAELRAGRVPFHEPGLAGLLRKNVRRRRLRFQESTGGAVEDAEFIFIAVQTPVSGSGRPAIGAARQAALGCARSARPGATIVVKSTVPPGFADELEDDLRGCGRPDLRVAANPEFLRQGRAVEDFRSPSRVVIGAHSAAVASKVAQLYGEGAPVLVVSPRAAELAKLASNAYLALRVSFVNELAELCDGAAAEFDEVRSVVTADARIGRDYFEPGPGFGGACLPKDLSMLTWFAAARGIESPALTGVARRNRRQRDLLLRAALDHSSPGSRVAILGLAFKAGTDDTRGSVALALTEELIAAGRRASVHDPLVPDGAIPRGARREPTAELATAGAGLIVLGAGWPEYQELDWGRIGAGRRRPAVIDMPRILDPRRMELLGFQFMAPGRLAGRTRPAMASAPAAG